MLSSSPRFCAFFRSPLDHYHNLFAKTAQKASFSMTENERFGLISANTQYWVYKFGPISVSM
jgi:hypothetical protein